MRGIDPKLLARRAARRLQRLAPESVRTVLRRSRTVERVRDWTFGGARGHDELYGKAYFEMVERTTAQSALAMAESIAGTLAPASVLDVGCGTGTLLAQLADLGVRGQGLEYARAALAACAARGLDVRRFDVEADPVPAGITPADVVVSMEVGQQLQPESSGRYVSLLCDLADGAVVFSSGVPGQGDRAPRNEQPHEFWTDLFHEQGFELDQDLSMQWRRDWTSRGTAPWFASNVMVLRRSRARAETQP